MTDAAVKTARPAGGRRSRKKPRLRITARDLRLYSGILLMVFVTTHLLNHALGLISLDAMEAGRLVFLALWRNPLGTLLVVASLLIHLALALVSIYGRRRLRMPPAEAVQLGLGLLILPLLAIHFVGTRGAHQNFGLDDRYAVVLLALWVDPTYAGVRQILASAVVWVHGCIGMYFWLRLKPWYRRAAPYLYGAALLLPVISMLGFVSAGREVAALDADPAWRPALLEAVNGLSEAQYQQVFAQERGIITGFVVLLVLTMAARAVRMAAERRQGVVRISYPDGKRAEMLRGPTLLEISRANDVPHASVCGGRGRCSTCRVRVNTGLDSLPPPSPAEQRVLERVGAAPNVRLACQIRPTEDLSVAPLLPPSAGPRQVGGQAAALQGQEREIAVLFADIRGFTTLSEHKLPYDVVFILNRYFRSMGEAVEQSGGRVDKFIGDGVMALFGLSTRPARAAAQALEAARVMGKRLDELNDLLAADLPQPLRIGVGIHAGPAIVGEMGYGNATSITAIGDTVNTASRLESMTKEFGAQLVVSQHVADLASVDLSAWPTSEQAVRGRSETLQVRIIPSAQDVPEPAPRRRRAAAEDASAAPA